MAINVFDTEFYRTADDLGREMNALKKRYPDIRLTETERWAQAGFSIARGLALTMEDIRSALSSLIPVYVDAVKELRTTINPAVGELAEQWKAISLEWMRIELYSRIITRLPGWTPDPVYDAIHDVVWRIPRRWLPRPRLAEEETS